MANVQLLFDNVHAPLIYAAQGQVAAIVPFGVFGRTTTKVQLVNGGLRSNVIDVPVADAAPGIFVLDASGQGAIINQDGTINSTDNPATAGSVIVLYATGAGQSSPAGQDACLYHDRAIVGRIVGTTIARPKNLPVKLLDAK